MSLIKKWFKWETELFRLKYKILLPFVPVVFGGLVIATTIIYFHQKSIKDKQKKFEMSTEHEDISKKFEDVTNRITQHS